MKELLVPVTVSLKVSVAATLVVFVFGLALAWIMDRVVLPGKAFIETLITLPLVLPPTVTGFGLLVLLGKNGPLGHLAEKLFHQPVIFTWGAAVVAAAVVAFPLMYQNARAGFEGVDSRQEQAARTLGAGELMVFFRITLPLAWPGIMAGLMLSFARALGEFGATLMVAGNIPGQTQTIPMAIYFAVGDSNYRAVLPLVACVTAFSFTLLLLLRRWSRRHVTDYRNARRY